MGPFVGSDDVEHLRFQLRSGHRRTPRRPRELLTRTRFAAPRPNKRNLGFPFLLARPVCSPPASPSLLTFLPAGPIPAHQSEMATPTRVVIDTDPGVDDMHALLLALGSPELVVEVRIQLRPVSLSVLALSRLLRFRR